MVVTPAWAVEEGSDAVGVTRLGAARVMRLRDQGTQPSHADVFRGHVQYCCSLYLQTRQVSAIFRLSYLSVPLLCLLLHHTFVSVGKLWLQQETKPNKKENLAFFVLS